MAWYDFGREKRAATVKSSDAEAYNFLFGGNWDDMFKSASDIVVTRENAITVPAVWAAVNFLSGTLAGLPLNMYKKTASGRETVTGQLPDMFHYAVNDRTSSFEWRKGMFDCVFTGGRGLSYIERGPSGQPQNLWLLDPSYMTVKISGMRKWYEYRDGATLKTYEAVDIIDIPFMLMPDGVTHKGPIGVGKDAIGLCIAVTNYGSKFLANGGVPPFAITGNFMTSQALKRASQDLENAVRQSSKEKRQALTLPAGLEIKPIGSDPEKSQMVETQRFCIEQIARLYQLPPVFLQDLTHGTFSNTEQQDLHLTKHVIKRWAEQFEQELNLKVFGRRANSRYLELNMDGLLRGDFPTRMAGNAQAITTGQLTPNEARRRENLPDMDGGDQLFTQGANVPLTVAGVANAD